MFGKGILTQKTFTHWIETVYTTQEHEIDCKQFQNYLPALVEAELNQTPLPHTAILNTHLRQCPDCTEIHHGLHLVMAVEDVTAFTSDATEFSPLPTGD